MACQGDSQKRGVGDVIGFNKHHVISFKVALGSGINILVELLILKLFFILSMEKCAQNLQ
jgi:hypothetical protein